MEPSPNQLSQPCRMRLLIFRPGGSRRGAALIITLAFLFLITALVLSFFTSVSSELVTSKTYATGELSRQLSDSVVQLAMGQIREATTTTASGGALAWASQPGMIRTYNTTGQMVKVYKLYSSSKMVDTSGAYDPTKE